MVIKSISRNNIIYIKPTEMKSILQNKCNDIENYSYINFLMSSDVVSSPIKYVVTLVNIAKFISFVLQNSTASFQVNFDVCKTKLLQHPEFDRKLHAVQNYCIQFTQIRKHIRNNAKCHFIKHIYRHILAHTYRYIVHVAVDWFQFRFF